MIHECFEQHCARESVAFASSNQLRFLQNLWKFLTLTGERMKIRTLEK